MFRKIPPEKQREYVRQYSQLIYYVGVSLSADNPKNK